MLQTLPLALWISAFFALAVCANVAVRLWLAGRQMRHVARHRAAVPAPFDASVSLQAHQRAADYTQDKLRVSVAELIVGAAVVLGWTLLGGLDALNAALLPLLADWPMAQQLALLACFGLIGSAIDLPFSLYQTFVIEARHGFNRMTPRMWLADLVKGSAIGLLLISLLLLLPAAQNAHHLIILSLFWGIAIMIIGLGMQVKVLALAPDATDVAMSLFSGIFNIGIGAGALVGSQVSTHLSMDSIGYIGAIPALVALVWSIMIFRRWPVSLDDHQPHHS